MYSTRPEFIDINESTFNRLAPDCECVALIFTVCHDPEKLIAIKSMYTTGDAVLLEQVQTQGSITNEPYRSTYKMYGRHASADGVVSALLEREIETQKQSDQETPFSWHVGYATEAIENNDTISELDGTYVGPERLDPPFNIPDDEPVSILDIPEAIHREINEVQQYKVGLPIDIERFRGKTYLIGITRDGCRALSDGCHERKSEHQQNDFFEESENADRAASILIDAPIETPEVSP